MYRVLGFITIATLTLLATPLFAQQDTSALGRQAQGIPTGDAGQPQPPDTAGLTSRQGIEGQEAGAQPGVSYREAGEEAAAAGETTEEGRAMPRTASSLPLLVVLGFFSIALGLGLRCLGKGSTLSTLIFLLAFGAFPLWAQKAADPGAAPTPSQGPEDRSREPQDVPGQTPQQRPLVEHENAARTEIPSVRGAKPNPLEQGGVGAIDAEAGAEPAQEAGVPPQEKRGPAYAGEAAVAQEAAPEAEPQAEVIGGEMPRTASSLPLLALAGSVLVGLGLALRILREGAGS